MSELHSVWNPEGWLVAIAVIGLIYLAFKTVTWKP